MTTPWYDDDDYTIDYDYVLCEKSVNRQFRLWFMPVFYTIIFVLSLVGNSLVMFTFLYYRRLKTMTDVYLLNLAFADLLFTLSLPLWVANSIEKWVLGLVMCKAMHAVYKVSFYSGMLLLSCISVDRYFAITKAVAMHRHRTKAILLSKLSSAIVWALALVFSTPELMNATIHHGTCTPQLYPLNFMSLSLHVSVQIILGFVAPLLVMTFCYGAIMLSLRQSRSFERNRALKVILAVAAVFFFCQVPYTLVLFLSTLEEAAISRDCSYGRSLLFALDVTRYLAFFRCCLNPFVYGFIGVKFRHDVLKLMRHVGCLTCKRFSQFSRRSSVADIETTTTFSP